MANTFQNTVKVVGDKMLEFFDGASTIASKINRDFDATFEATKESLGQSVNVPKPPRYTAQDGPVISVIQDINVGTIPVKIDKWKTVFISTSALDMNFNAKEFDAWAEKWVKPMVSPLVNAADIAIFGLYNQIPNYVGAAGTGFGTTQQAGLDLIGAAREMLTYQNTPMEDRMIWLNPAGSRKFIQSVGLGFNPQRETGEMIKSGIIMHVEGFDVYEAVNVALHTVGTAAPTATIQTNNGAGVYAVGTSLAVDAMTGSTYFAAGDVITVDGVYEVNPTSGKSTGTLKRWLVTAATTSSGSATLALSPPIIPSGAFKNMTGASADLAGIPDNKNVNLIAGTNYGTQYAQPLAFWKKAIGIVTVPVRAPEGLHGVTRTFNGMSVTCSYGSDIFQFAQYFRVDMVYGVTAFYPENALRMFVA